MKQSVFGDVCGVMMLAKELKTEKCPPVQLRLQLPDLRQPVKDFFNTREVGEFFSGALAGAMTKAVLAPLETIRTRMIVGIGSKNIAGSFIEVVEKQGWKGLWAERWKQEESPHVQIGDVTLSFSLSWISPVAVAGAAAGVVSTLICHPLEVLKDRLTVSPVSYPNLTVSIGRIYKDSGVGGFYAGLFPTLVGMLPYSTCYYFMYETMKKSYCTTQKKKSLSRMEMLFIGALSGFTASTISFPLEVARKRLMVGALEGKCPPHMVAALSEVIRNEGLAGLYRGWGASCLKVMPSSGITWMFYEAWKDILLAERRAA
ncbi:unnamed protein product [Rhodiola kirilowii]